MTASLDAVINDAAAPGMLVDVDVASAAKSVVGSRKAGIRHVADCVIKCVLQFT